MCDLISNKFVLSISGLQEAREAQERRAGADEESDVEEEEEEEEEVG